MGDGPRPGADLRKLAGLGAGAAVLLAGTIAGCSSSSGPFHGHFEAGRYRQAMEVFRADSSLHDDEDALYRAGLLYASPDSPRYDPARATETLERLLDLHPGTDHRHEARHLLALLAEVRSLGGRVAELRDQLEKLKAVDLEEAPADSAGGGG